MILNTFSHIISWHLYKISWASIIILILEKKTLGTAYLFLKPGFIRSDYKECLGSQGEKRNLEVFLWVGFSAWTRQGGLMESANVLDLIRDCLPPLRA